MLLKHGELKNDVLKVRRTFSNRLSLVNSSRLSNHSHVAFFLRSVQVWSNWNRWSKSSSYSTCTSLFHTIYGFLTLCTINLWCIILRCVSLYVACVTASYIQSTSMLNINVHVFIIQRVFSVSYHALQHLPSTLSSDNAATSPVGSHSGKEVIFCINMYVIHRFKFCSVSHLLTNVGIDTGKSVTD